MSTLSRPEHTSLRKKDRRSRLRRHGPERTVPPKPEGRTPLLVHHSFLNAISAMAARTTATAPATTAILTESSDAEALVLWFG